MPQQGTPYLIPFGNAGMVAHPNRWRAKAGEVLLAENVVVENDLINKEPASAYYDPAGVDLLRMKLQWTSSADALGLAVWYRSTAGGGFATPVAQGGSTNPGSPWTLTILNPIPAGAVHVVRVSRKAGTGAATAITDSQGNAYSLVYDVSALGLQGQIWVAVLTRGLATTDTVSLTMADPTADVNAYTEALTNLLMPLTLVNKQTANASAVTTLTVGGSGHSHYYPLIGLGMVVYSSLSPSSPILTDPFTNATTHLVTAGGYVLLTSDTFPFMSLSSIVAQREWTSDATNTPAGTVNVRANDPSVIGTGTAFTTAFRPGDDILVGGERHTVQRIQSDTALVTTAPWEVTQTGMTMVRRAGPVLITAVNREDFTTGAIYKEIPTGDALGAHGTLNGVTLTTSIAKLRHGRFVVGGKEDASRPRKLFYLNGIDPIQVLAGDGTTMTAISKPTADWGTAQDATKQPINAIVHQDSLVAFGNLNDPHRVYFSTPNDHEDFQTTAAPAVPYISIRIASNVGQRLYGAAQFQGVLFLWKYPNGIFYIDDTGANRLTDWSYRIRSMALGCAPSPYAVLATDDDVIFCDSQGHFHLLSAVADLGGTRDSDITRALGLHTWTQQNVDVTALDQLVSVYDGETKTAWFGMQSVTGGYGGNNDLVIRWDFSLVPSGGPLRMTTARCWIPNSLCLKRRDYTGRQAVLVGEVGDAWLVIPGQYGSRVNRDFVNAVDQTIGIPTRISIPELDYGDTQPGMRAIRKSFRALEMIAQATENKNHPVSMTINIDGVYRQTMQYPQGPNRRRLQPLQCGDGYSLSGDITTDGSVVGDVPLIGLIVYYAPTGTDMSRKS